MIRWLREIESWLFKVHETYASLQERTKIDKDFEIDFKETLLKIEKDRKIKLYYKNKDLDAQKLQNKLEK